MARKKYVTYRDAWLGLWRRDMVPTTPTMYIQELRKETGLSYAKIAHDLSVDCGLNVIPSTVGRWAKEK